MKCWIVKNRNVGYKDRKLMVKKIGNIRMNILCTITDIVENTGKSLKYRYSHGNNKNDGTTYDERI